MSNTLVEEAIEKTTLDLQSSGQDVSKEVVKETYLWYMKSVRKLMGFGNTKAKSNMINRITVPGLGSYILIEQFFKQRGVTKIGSYDYNDGILAHNKLCDRSWRYTGWTKESGYIFFNDKEEYFYRLKRDGLFNTLSAYIYFDKIADTEFVKNGYDVYLGENIKEAKIINGGVNVFDSKKDFVVHYDTLGEALDSHYLPRKHIHEILIYNTIHYSKPFRLRDEYWFFDSIKMSRHTFGITHLPIKIRTVFDIIEDSTNRVVMERIGTLTDICEYLTAYGYTKMCKTGIIKRTILNKKRIYGFKFRRSTIQLSKYEEKRNRRKAESI